MIQAVDSSIRFEIYRSFAATGTAPTVAEIAAALATTADTVVEAYRRLHDRRELVLGKDRTSLLMMLPFSAVTTPVAPDGMRWWANCAWDSLGVPIALGMDATVHAIWSEDGSVLTLRSEDGALAGPRGVVHFGTPATDWWKDIVDT